MSLLNLKNRDLCNSSYSIVGSTASFRSIILNAKGRKDGGKDPDSISTGTIVVSESIHASTSSLNWSGFQSHVGLSGKPSKLLTEVQLPTGEHVQIASPQGSITLPLALTAAATVIGSSVPHGWNTGVLNAPSHLIIGFLNETYENRYGYAPDAGILNLLWATSVSVYLVGGCGGAFAAGWLANLLGRKKALLFTHIFGFIAAFLFGFCKMAGSFEMLILARIIVGFSCGAGSGLVPMYLTEIAPVNLRGAMGVLHQFGLTVGIFLSQCFGLRSALGNDGLWNVLLAATAVPCVLSILVLPWFPDSPRYLLVNKDDEDEATKALVKFRGTKDVQLDIQEMRLEQLQQLQEPEWSFRELLKTKHLRLPLFVLVVSACCQQLSGINIVFYYSVSVFEASGIPPHLTQYAVLGTGLINVIMTGISVTLMDKSGRRPLLLGGMGFMIIMGVVVTVALNLQQQYSWMSYASLVCIIGFVIGFSIGLGSIPQFIGAELFKQGPRPPAMSIAGFLNWLCNFIVGITFPSIQMALGAYSFLVFIVIVLLSGIFLWFKLPETKNRTHEEIYLLFRAVDEENYGNGDLPALHSAQKPLLSKAAKNKAKEAGASLPLKSVNGHASDDGHGMVRRGSYSSTESV